MFSKAFETRDVCILEWKEKKAVSGTIKNISAKRSLVCSKITGKAEDLKFKVQSYDVGGNKKMKGLNGQKAQDLPGFMECN